MRTRGLPTCMVLAAALAGCSSYRDVPRSEWSPTARYDDVRLATIDGFEYHFDSVVAGADSLVGYYKVSQERSSEGSVWYEDVDRRYPIPRNRVVRLELVRKDPVKTTFYGAGFAAAGYLLVSFVEEKVVNPSSGGSGGGKGTGKP